MAGQRYDTIAVAGIDGFHGLNVKTTDYYAGKH